MSGSGQLASILLVGWTLALAPMPASAQAPLDEPRLLVAGIVGDEEHRVEIWTIGNSAWIGGPGFDPSPQPLTVQSAVRLLADPRAKSMWEPIIRWGEADLSVLRDRRIAAARIAAEGAGVLPLPTQTSEAIVGPRVRAVLQLAEALSGGGKIEEAIDLLRRTRGNAPPGADIDRATEYLSLTLRLASAVRLRDGNGKAAVRILEEARPLLDPVYGLNMDVNRAAMLAQDGRHAEALALIEAAEADFRNRSSEEFGSDRARVPGSLRQFRWIRACALHGLGRTDEARTTFAQVVAAPEPGEAAWVAASNLQIRLRARNCMGDVEGLVDEFIAQLDGGLPGQLVFEWVQPGALLPLVAPATVAAVRAHPRLIAAMAGRVRLLPPELTPALNDWRQGAQVR